MADFTAVDAGLFAVFAAVLLGPFFIKKIEENLEVFLFINGVIAASIASMWSLKLVEEALLEPILKGIVPAVLIAGVIFHYGRKRAEDGMKRFLKKIPLKWMVFGMIVVLGLISSIITAIIAALLLVEMVHVMPLDRVRRTQLVIITCFSIGLGAVLTPLGEPLSTLAVTTLQGPPYHADFFFLFNQLGIYVFPGVIGLGVLGAYMIEPKNVPGAAASLKEPGASVRAGDAPEKGKKLRAGKKGKDGRRTGTKDGKNGKDDRRDCINANLRDGKMAGKRQELPGNKTMENDGREKTGPEWNGEKAHSGKKETAHTQNGDVFIKEGLNEVFIRGAKVYVFVMALLFLGAGMKVIINKYLAQVPAEGLYWVNMISAVLDNATLTAAEIGPTLSLAQIKGALMGLLIAGGMLIPGNIPNIIAAGKLKISSKEWARLGVPLGVVVMFIYFVWLYVVKLP